MIDLSKMTIQEKAKIVGKNQRLIANQIYGGNDKASNVLTSSQKLVESPNVPNTKVFENNFDIWFKENEKLIDVE